MRRTAILSAALFWAAFLLPCFGQSSGGNRGGSSGGGLPSAPTGSIQFNNAGAFGGSSSATLDGSGNMTAASLQIGSGLPSDSSTTNGKAGKVGGTAQIVAATVSDTDVPVWPVVSGGGTANVFLATSGQASVIFDAAATQGDYIGASTTAAASFHDLGATCPANTWTIGQVVTTLGSAGSTTVQLAPEFCPGSAASGFNPLDSTTAWAHDDFLPGSSTSGQIGELGWDSTCTSISYAAAVSGHPGIASCVTSTTSGNVAALHLDNGGNGAFQALGSTTNWEFRFIVLLSTNATVAYRIGIMGTNQVTADPPTNGIWIRFDTGAADTTWTYETRSSSVSTTSTTNAVAPDTTSWWTIRIRSTSAGTVLFSTAKNGAAFTTETPISTNVPTGELSPDVEIVTRTTAAANAHVDWFAYNITGLTR